MTRQRRSSSVLLILLLAGLSRVASPVDAEVRERPGSLQAGRAISAENARGPDTVGAGPARLDLPARPEAPSAQAPAAGPQTGPDNPPNRGVYRGTDPSRDLKPFEPKPLNIVRRPGTVPLDRGRTIVLRRGSIDLLHSATTVRRIPFNGWREVGLEEVVDTIADPEWATWDGYRVLRLRAALVQDVGTRLRISSSDISEVRLESLPGVFLGGTAASARIQGVLIRSWIPDRRGPDPNDRDGRPFILYEDDGARLDIIDSEIAYLGEDRVTAYGLAWRQGATGSLINSDLHHNFFAVYTHEATDMVFRGNRLHHNIYYGLDPHDYSARLIVEDNEAWANGSHGIIFSRGVVDSVVRRNYSHDNGGNGIMMDLDSDRNQVVLNRVENNAKDGIVAHASSDLLVADNLVRGNREGIRSKGDSLRNKFVGNRLVGNGRGIELYGGVRGALLQDNIVRGSKEIGMVLDAPGSRVINGIVEGSERGVEARAPVSISGLQVLGVERGLVVRPGVVLRGHQLKVEASKAAVERERRAVVTLSSSQLRSDRLEPGRTVNWGPGTEEQGPGLPWTATVGIGLIAAAVALELLHLMRSRRTPRGPEQPMWSAGG